MKSVAVLYATREGQTRRIAERVAVRLREGGFIVDVLEVGREAPLQCDLTRYVAAVVAASVHVGKHERTMVEFVKAHRGELERIPSTFLSVSLSEAGAEDPSATAERREHAATNVNTMISTFLRETGWNPMYVHPIAGALLYRQYGVVVRLVMRFIAKQAGATTDTLVAASAPRATSEDTFLSRSIAAAYDRFGDQRANFRVRPVPDGRSHISFCRKAAIDEAAGSWREPRAIAELRFFCYGPRGPR